MSPRIALGLRRVGVDVTTTREAGLFKATDEAHLAYALETGRVIVTQDKDFLEAAGSGVRHAGIVFVHNQTRSIGQIIEFIQLVAACVTEEDMVGRVEFA